MFRRDDVGAVEQQIGWQACGQVADFELLVQRQRRGQIVGDFLANQQFQSVARLLAGAHGGGVAGFGVFNHGFLRAQIQRGNHACFVAHFCQIVGFLVAGERFFG